MKASLLAAVCAGLTAMLAPTAGAVASHGRLLARGSTAAATEYSISSERDPECESIMVTFAESSPEGEAFNSVCVPGPGGQFMSLACRRARRVGIEALVPSSVRRMRLKLANGRAISSSVTLVRIRAGESVSAYYQALRTSAPMPVSLTELDGSGRVLGVLRFHDYRSCLHKSRGGETIEGGGKSAGR